MRRTLACVFVGLSLAGLIIGCFFPIAAKLHDPFLAYGIVFVSWPAWAMGALAGALASLMAHRMQPRDYPLRRWGSVSSLSNITAALAVLFIPFHVS